MEKEKERDMLLFHLANVIEWGKGNRGSKNKNPYGVPEIENALKFIAGMRRSKEWLDVDTKLIAANYPQVNE